jgi:hypothetical protein
MPNNPLEINICLLPLFTFIIFNLDKNEVNRYNLTGKEEVANYWKPANNTTTAKTLTIANFTW